MKIKGLESFKRQIEKRLTKELGFKNEPWVLVDGIEVDYIADGTPVLTVKIRAGYTFQNNHYQYDKTIELGVDGRDIEFVAGMFANEIGHCDTILI